MIKKSIKLNRNHIYRGVHVCNNFSNTTNGTKFRVIFKHFVHITSSVGIIYTKTPFYYGTELQKACSHLHIAATPLYVHISKKAKSMAMYHVPFTLANTAQ